MILVAWLYFVNAQPCYTDALERVPAAYAAQAQRVEIGTLETYPRYTPANQH